MLRSRNSLHSAAVKAGAPRATTSRTSRRDSWIGRRLDDAERPALRLLGDRGVVLEVDLGVEAAGEHPLVVADQVVADADVLELQAGQRGEVAVGAGVEARRDQVDELDRARARAPAT